MILMTRILSAEHQMFRAMFDEVEELLPGLERVQDVKRLARLVEGLLRKHAKAEDDLLMLPQARAQADDPPYMSCRHEHQEIDGHLTLVHSARSVGQARTLLCKAMVASRKHFQLEERRIFPLMEKRIPHEALAKLGTMWFLQRHAPTNWMV